MIAEAASSLNISTRVTEQARERPSQRALVLPGGRTFTFTELEARIDALARGLSRAGIGRGTRTALLVRPGLDFFATLFALFRLGAVPVLIDPAIGASRLFSCLAQSAPEAFIGVPESHLGRLLRPGAFRSVKVFVSSGARVPFALSLSSLADPGPFAPASTGPDELAAILFTSGSTGPPKGVLYTHGVLDAQVDRLQALFDLRPGEIDVPTFPVFALFDPALGLTAVIPDMDARYPARADPARIAAAVVDNDATSLFASPALLDNLSRWAVGRTFPTLRRILTAGAPVRLSILRRTAALLAPGAQVFTPFGATECLPVASIGSDEVLGETAARTAEGEGVCVGRPAPGVLVRILRISDEPIDRLTDDWVLPQGQMGEIAVAGPVVTPGYFRRPDFDRLHKVADGNRVWHRMGDLGRLDASGRLWMAGRKSHRVETGSGTLYSVCLEGVFDQHPGVRRSALCGVGPRGNQRPVLVVEPEPGAGGQKLVEALLELGARYPVTAAVRDIRLYPGSLPVDVRHNAKIDREKLGIWAS